jgi:hypothetical protein
VNIGGEIMGKRLLTGNKVYIVTYYIGYQRENDKRLEFYSAISKRTFDELKSEVNKWNYYDISDDPSFFAYRVLRNKQDGLSWGICRPDLRNVLEKDDVVMFFAVDIAEKNNRCDGVNNYYFIGYATVKEKIKQIDIWDTQQYTDFQKYCNLVIRRSNDGKVRYQEIIEDKYGHKRDWLWKIADNYIGCGDLGTLEVTKNSFGKLSKDFCETPISEIPGQIKMNSNYIVFHKDANKIRILDKPMFVATYKKEVDGRLEKWNDDTHSSSLRELIMKGKNRKNLRIDNDLAHRHIRITPSDGIDKFKENLNKIIDEFIKVSDKKRE